VHQDGLVHVSALADRFIKDPREVVKPGDVVKVKVVEVDVQRKRIALTMRMTDDGEKRGPADARRQPAPQTQAAKSPAKPAPKQPAPQPPSAGENAFAAAFARAQNNKKK
jgi:protein Tex